MEKKKQKSLWKRNRGYVLVGLISLVLSPMYNSLRISYLRSEVVDKETSDLVLYIFGIKNLKKEQKIHFITSSPYMPETMKEKAEKIADYIFPDKDTRYSIDSAFAINFHKMNGNPKIFVGNIDGDHKQNLYIPDEHCIIINHLNSLNSNRLTSVSMTGYMEEIAHAQQFSGEPFKYCYKRTWDDIYAFLSSVNVHDLKDSYEYEAHRKISLDLRRLYFSYRKEFFKRELEQVERKQKKARIWLDFVANLKAGTEDELKKTEDAMTAAYKKEDSLLFCHSDAGLNYCWSMFKPNK